MVKNKGDKMINGVDMLIDKQYKREKKKISIIRTINDKYSLKINDIVIENSDMRKLEIDEDNIIITIKLPKDLYYIK